MNHFGKQTARISKAFGLALVSRLMYTTACIFKLLKQEVEAELFLLESFKTSLTAMNALYEWNDNRRVFDFATGLKIAFYQATLETMIQELENR